MELCEGVCEEDDVITNGNIVENQGSSGLRNGFRDGSGVLESTIVTDTSVIACIDSMDTTSETLNNSSNNNNDLNVNSNNKLRNGMLQREDSECFLIQRQYANRQQKAARRRVWIQAKFIRKPIT